MAGPRPGVKRARRSDIRAGARCAGEVVREGDHMVRDRHAGDGLLEGQNLLGVHDLLQLGVAVRCDLADDRHLLLLGGVVDDDVEHEAVKLRLGQGIGALLLDRVLRGEDEERLRKRIRMAGHGDGVLLHRLKEGGLGLGRGAVDFVREQHVREDGALDEAEGALSGRLVLVEDVGARDVGGHEIGRELDALEREVEDAADGADEQGLGEARHADEKGVTTAEDGHEDFLDHVRLADDHLGQLLLHALVGVVDVLNLC